MKSLKHPLVVIGLILGMATLIGAVVENANTPLFGTVDFSKALNDCKAGKAAVEEMDALSKFYAETVDTINGNPFLDSDEFSKIRKVLIPSPTADGKMPAVTVPTAEGKATIKALLDKATERQKRFTELYQKADATEVEKAEQRDLNKMMGTSRDNLQQLGPDLRSILQDKQAKSTKEIVEQIKVIVSQMAKTSNCSMVFVAEVAPYSSNDFTQAVLTEMNKKYDETHK
jgi:Skp family chaperone for outer membrane proteins